MNQQMSNTLSKGNQTEVVLIGKDGQTVDTICSTEVADKICSTEVAEMIEVEHSKLLRSIRNYSDYLGQANIGQSDFFLESTYLNSQNKEQPCYQVTKKGCEMIANKLTGQKGVVFTAKYIERFHEMQDYIIENKKHDSYMIDDPIERAKVWIIEQQEKQVLQLENAQNKQIIGELKPKATYYDLVLQSTDLVPITLIAKDYGMSGSALNKKLHQLGVQYQQSGVWLLYAQYHGLGYTYSKTQSYQKHDGTTGTKLHTQWTQKGRLFIYEVLKQNGILPMIERGGL